MTSVRAVLANMPETSLATGTASWSATTLLATRQALNWASRRSAAWPINHTTSIEDQVTGEAKLSGPFSFLGREHELTLGANYGRTHHDERGHYKDVSGNQIASLADVLAGNVAQPALNYTDDLNTQLFTDRQKSLYAGARFSVVDDLHWIAGARMLSADADGAGYGSPHDTRVHGKVTPYTGLVYDLTPQWSLYTSWTKIFKPQYVRSTSGGVILPFEGKSTEAGVKGLLLDDSLSVTAAVIDREHEPVDSYFSHAGVYSNPAIGQPAPNDQILKRTTSFALQLPRNGRWEPAPWR